MREVRIFFMQAKLSLMTASIFRANFILMLIQSIINTLLHVACMDFIYGSVEEIGGWEQEEMLVLICTSMVINQLFRLMEIRCGLWKALLMEALTICFYGPLEFCFR